MYKVEFASSAAKEFRALPAELKRRITPAIDALMQNPYPRGLRKLAGHDKLYRVRVGQYRIVYEIDDDTKSILITRVRHRRDAYR
jgi:mRNA interferase RelE/StbE